MSSQISYACDRCGYVSICGSEFIRRAQQLLSGKHAPALDLCLECERALQKWLEAGDK